MARKTQDKLIVSIIIKCCHVFSFYAATYVFGGFRSKPVLSTPGGS